MENVTIFTHPLIQHKISILRNKNTGTNEFRSLIEEIAMLMGYEALRDLPTEDVEVETPIETCMTPMIAGKKLAIVPILRAGLGMINGILALVPSAKVGHIGLYRDEETHEPLRILLQASNPDRPENHCRNRPDACYRWFCRCSCRFHQTARWKAYQIHGDHRSSGRIKTPA